MLKVLNACAAAFLSLLSQGIGHLYLGLKKRAAFLIALTLFNYCFQLFGLAIGFSLLPTKFNYVYWAITSYLLLYVFWVIFDSIRLSQKTPTEFNIKYLPSNKVLRFLTLFLLAVLLSAGTTLILPSKSVYHYSVPGVGMSPTLEKGDQIVAVESTGAYLTEMRNAVVTYNFRRDELDPESYKIHLGRIAAVEGDKVRIDAKSGNVFVNGSEYPLKNRGTASYEELKLNKSLTRINDPFVNALWENKEVEVPLGHFFILQDNYSNSIDSRDKGPVDAARIGERVSFIYFSRDDSGLRWDRINKMIE